MYSVIMNSVRCITEVENSKFICDLYYCESTSEAIAFLKDIKEEFLTATHHCYAYRIGLDQVYVKSSDDGEPSGTAGRPLAQILEHKNLINVICVVTRYYGGTKLGVGGLIRAYSNALLEALESAQIGILEKRYQVKFIFDYGDINQINYILQQKNAIIIEKTYDLKVTYLCLLIKLEDLEEITKVNHKVFFETLNDTYYRVEE